MKLIKTNLAYLISRVFVCSFRTILDWDELTEDIANIPDLEGRTPIVYCLTIGNPYIARDILIHPTAKKKFRLDVGKSADRKSALHLVAQQGKTHLIGFKSKYSYYCLIVLL